MISFASLEFMFRFLPVFLIIYYAFPTKHRNTILLIGSIVFYAVGEPVFLFCCLFFSYMAQLPYRKADVEPAVRV